MTKQQVFRGIVRLDGGWLDGDAPAIVLTTVANLGMTGQMICRKRFAGFWRQSWWFELTGERDALIQFHKGMEHLCSIYLWTLALEPAPPNPRNGTFVSFK